MTFVITQYCCNDGSCVSVCPVQCIRPRPGDPQYRSAEQLYIDPETCIECGACADACPVGAIYSDLDLPAHYHDYLAINADHFAANPITDWSPLADSRTALPIHRPRLRVAIVGTGPSACYAAGELTANDGIEVSIFDRLPTPFGLVRAGVAPDHQPTKMIADEFEMILARPSVRCFFNVEVGRDVTIGELLAHNHAVIYAAGADDDRRLGIPGEDLPGSFSAREFVAWYNGHPDHADRAFDLTGERVVIIGNGNVALDVARALTLTDDVLGATDMADHAIRALRKSAVREVVVAARRGPGDASYTTAELLALSKLDGVGLVTRPEETAMATPGQNARRPDTGDWARKLEIVAAASRSAGRARRRISLRYLLTPVSINGDDHVSSITFERSNLVRQDGRAVLRPTGETERIETRLVLRAIGYRGRPVEGLPFDSSRGVIANDRGRVVDLATGASATGLYCAGWIKRGATGVIGTNRACSAETVEMLLSDFAAGQLIEPAHDIQAFEALVASRRRERVDLGAWQTIDRAERERGADTRRPRRKFLAISDMVVASEATISRGEDHRQEGCA